MTPPKLFNIVKNRKLLNATTCSAVRCKDPVHGNCPGKLWGDLHDVALCAKHMGLAFEHSERMKEQAQQGAPVLAVVPSHLEAVQVEPTWAQTARENIAWIQSLFPRAEAVASAARGHVVQDQRDMEGVTEWLRQAKGVRNRIKEREDEITAPLKKILRVIAELTAPSKRAWEQAEGLLRGVLSAAAVAEAGRNQQLASEAATEHATGGDATAAVGQMTTSTDLEGVSVKLVWSPVIQDASKLPDRFIERRVNLPELKKYADSFKGREPDPVPGVAWKQDAPLRVRGK